MIGETRQQLIARLIDERKKRIAAEAERYEDKRMDGPPPGCVAIKHMIGSTVVLKIGVDGVRGMVTDIDIHPYGVVYHVCWGDTRCTTAHYEFELEEADDDGLYGHAAR